MKTGATEPGVRRETTAVRSLAEERVLFDLVGALLAENVCGIAERAVEVQREGELFLRVDMEPMRYLLIPVRAASMTAYRCRSADLVEVQIGEHGEAVSARLNPLQLMRRVKELAAARNESLPGLAVFEADLHTAILHTELSMRAICEQAEAGVDPFESFAAAERYASFRDRPFHPTARVKGGFSADDYRSYCAEYGAEICLRWLAVRRSVLTFGAGTAAGETADLVLDRAERARLGESFDRAGISEADYLALPVHPWQLERVILTQFVPEIEARDFIPLDFVGGAFQATSSVRSLVPKRETNDHLKLPIGIISLGARRVLPALYMLNGERGQRLLAQAIERDQVLASTLALCDEGIWWAYHLPGSDLFEDRPRHLSALIRRYPDLEAGDQLLPMSALCVDSLPQEGHLFDRWLKHRGEAVTKRAICDLFQEVCTAFFSAALRLLRLGVLPEMHGQNVVLRLRAGRVVGLLLRDHDTVRLHLPWMRACRLDDPGYIVKPDRPNSLYNDSPDGLIYYLQTLCISVNLYAILDALSRAYSIDEAELWLVVRQTLAEGLNEVPFAAEQRAILDRELFERQVWPTKLLITPLLQQSGPAGASMPAGSGTTINPLCRAELTS